MRRKRKKGRVLGPYPNRRGFRLVVVAPTGARRSVIAADREEADQLRPILEEELAAQVVTVNQALEEYREVLATRGAGVRRRRPNKPRSIETTVQRLRSLFTDGDEVLADLTAKRCDELYESLRTRASRQGQRATDTHVNTLSQARTFLRWAEGKGYIIGRPLESVDPVGERRRGKLQLRIDEGRVLLDYLVAELETDDPRALAVAIAILMAPRATEIASIDARDIDDRGRILWIPESKSERGRRFLEVPPVLVDAMVLAKERAAGGRVFPGRDRHWVLRAVRRACKAAGVLVVTAHGLRGTHSSVAAEQGMTPPVVAAALGHGVAVNQAHYTRQGAADRGTARRAAERLVH